MAAHDWCWAARQTITDPVHVTAAVLGTACQARAAQIRAPAAGAVAGLRAISDHDEIFAPTPSLVTAPRPDVQAAR